MRTDKRRKLEAAGWKVGSAAEFLELSPEEEALVAVKLRLAKEKTAYRPAAEGKLPGFRVGGSWRLKESDIEK